MSATSTATPVRQQGVRNWALDKVDFPPDAQTSAGDPGKTRPIAIIDVGGAALGHPLLSRRTKYVSPQDLRPSTPAGSVADGAHAAEVAGTIASACAAELIVYNIGTTSGWDRELFVAALEDVLIREPTPAVLNISVGWHKAEPLADGAIKACISKGISVVVAMGDNEESSDLEWFPGVTDGVIAVGATDRYDLRLPDSNMGDHIWIAAPGEDIRTVVNAEDYGVRNGTSFAAALVSAAVWYVVRANPQLTPDEIRKGLGDSADSTLISSGSPPTPRTGPANGKWNAAVGCGRLNVAKLAKLV